MRRSWPFVWMLVLSVSVHAQWLNFRTPGTPRTPDGKPNLAAPTPRTADGKPDLSGVWMHETTTIAEMKRLFGAAVDAEIATSVPGMELDTVHKYAVSLLADFKLNEQPLTPLGWKVVPAEPQRARPGARVRRAAALPAGGSPVRADQDRPGPAPDARPLRSRQPPSTDRVHLEKANPRP